ncbi:MAG: hypothetical protein AAFN10_06540 [Bacteroidota bacterium]
MKSIVLAFGLTLLFALPIKAQDSYKHQLSVSFTSVQLAQNPFQQFLPNTSIMYRHNLGRLKLRLQGQRLATQEKINYSSQGSGFQSSSSILLGAQYGKTWGRLALYGLLDLGYGRLFLSESAFSSYALSLRGLQTQVGLGLDLRITKRWSLSIESAVTYIFGKGDGYPNQLNVFDFQGSPTPPITGGELIIRPINAVWLSYSFGKH